ncbi:MAG: GNAT family N-acetyltransferase [Candidatus Eisenbacteria bacterium]
MIHQERPHIVRPEELAEVATFVSAHNRDPRMQCLHTGAADPPEAILASMRKGYGTSEMTGVIARDHGRIVGFCGAEFDLDLRRAWIWGPFADRANDALDAGMRDELWEDLCAVLPHRVAEAHAYVNAESADLREWYEGRGFERTQVAHIMSAPPDTLRGARVTRAEIACNGAVDVASFSRLHHALFPNSYFEPERLLRDRDEDRLLWTDTAPDGALRAYVYATVDPGEGGACIDFVGTDPDHRGAGRARRLLLVALDRLLGERTLPEVHLVVRDELTAARSLYESVGFRLLRTGIALRRSLDPAD